MNKYALLSLLLVILSPLALAQDFALNEINFKEILHPITKKPIEINHEIRYLDSVNNQNRFNLEIIRLNPDLKERQRLLMKEDQKLLSNLWLARILDYELLKSKQDLNPTDLRTIYVARVILHNAYKAYKLPLEDFSKKSNEELYELLKDLVKEKNVGLTINWKYAPAELKIVQELVASEKIQYPDTRIYFEKLPQDFIAFHHEIKNQLQAVILPILRQSIFENLVKYHAADFTKASQSLATMPEIEALYEKIKKEKYGVYKVHAEGIQLSLPLLNPTQKTTLNKELEKTFAQIKDESKANKLKIVADKIKELFKEAIVEKTVIEDFTTQSKTETLFPKEIEFYSQALPFKMTETKETTSFLFALDSKIEFINYLTINEALDDLREIAQTKYLNGGIRKTLYLLMKQYPISRTYNTCGLDHLICNEMDENIAINALTNEVLIDSKVKTSITDRLTMHKAYMIQISNLEDIYKMKLLMGEQ